MNLINRKMRLVAAVCGLLLLMTTCLTQDEESPADGSEEKPAGPTQCYYCKYSCKKPLMTQDCKRGQDACRAHVIRDSK